MATPYSVDDDPSAGGSHFAPNGGDTSQAAPYSTAQDPGIGGPPPPIINHSWPSLSDAGAYVANAAKGIARTVGGAVHAFDTPENREAAAAGIEHGVRSFWDKVREGGYVPTQGPMIPGGPVAPLPGYPTPTPDLLDRIKQQNAADRAERERKYGDNASFDAGNVVGQVVGTAPVTGPVGAGLNVGLKALPVAASATRGLTGIGLRAAERATTGTVMGGTQAGMTADPDLPLLPQIGAGALAGTLFGVGGGALSDITSNVAKRLSGSVARLNPYTGQLLDETTQRAVQAKLLADEGVPVAGSQVSNDPLLQTTAKYGGAAPWSGTPDFLNNQAQVFRNRALQRVEPGTPASMVTKDFVTNNDARIDGMYQNSVQAVPSVPEIGPSGLPIDREFGRIRSTIPQGLTPEAQAQIHGVMNDVSDAFRNGGGQISGSDAQLLTRRTNSALSPLLDSDNGVLRNYGMQIRDQVNQRLRSQMSPVQQLIFDDANSRFRALRTVQDAADSSGSFEPKHLYDATSSAAEKFGPGSLDDLAAAGKTVIQPGLDARGAVLPRAAGAASPLAAAAFTATVLKPALDLLLSGGAGSAVGAGAVGANRVLQGVYRASGPRAINTVLSGGGLPVADIQRALSYLQLFPAAGTQSPRPDQQ
jgi:hypothetical protein